MVNEEKKPKLVILMPMVWSIRNVVHSGLLGLLQDVDVHLLIHDFDASFSDVPLRQAIPATVGCQALCIPQVKRRIKGLALLREVLDNAFSRLNAIGSYWIYRRWRSRHFSSIQRTRSRMVEILGYFAQPRPFYQRLVRLYNDLYRKEYDLTPIKQQLRELQPDLILSTVNVDDVYERAYVLAAQELGIPVVNEVLSFDNTTTQPRHLVYDRYIVWNQRMKDQVLAFYPQVKPDQVSVTSTPQFDFHRRQDCRWAQEDTVRHLGMPPGAKYFLYGASVSPYTPAEPELVAHLAEKMSEHSTLRDYWLIVRIHPRDNKARWESVCKGSERVLLSIAWGTKEDSGGWAFPTMLDYGRLTSSLVYATACINIASTISLDAAILDRPVIGIRFNPGTDGTGEILYEEYDTDHYCPLVESGGLRMAQTWDELLELMVQAIENPERDRSARVRMVEQECGLVDGNAAQRVANALSDYLKGLRG